jgi:hypothetical protein
MRVLADLLYSDVKKRENTEKYRFFGADSHSMRSVELRDRGRCGSRVPRQMKTDFQNALDGKGGKTGSLGRKSEKS